MGYMIAMGNCVGCRKFFTFNPELVPSIRIKGEKEPICRECIERVNPQRIANGLEPVVIRRGAYEQTEEI